MMLMVLLVAPDFGEVAYVDLVVPVAEDRHETEVIDLLNSSRAVLSVCRYVGRVPVVRPSEQSPTSH